MKKAFSSLRLGSSLRRAAYIVVVFISLFAQPVNVYAEATTPEATATPAPTTTETSPPPATEPTPAPDPAPAASATPPAAATETAPPPTQNQGPTSPPGDAAKTYTYNPATGLWENDKYTWNPATQQTTPKTAPTYSYNPSTGMWDTTGWKYDAPSGKYVENIISQPTAPAGLSNSLQAALADTDPSNPTASKAKGLFDLFYNAAISNHNMLTAVSGDAFVTGNTTGGGATSGDALSMANLINLLQSSWDYMAHGGLNTFVSNLFGDVTGDLTLNPTATSGNNASPNQDVTVNASGSSAIENDILVGAKTGDAAVSKNTNAGDATTGDANALANIINSISSSISAGQSFFGVLNIFGNLNGDVLFSTPLGKLLSTGSGATATPASSSTVQTTTQQTINNNVNAATATGDASVTKNTSAGTASTGNATSDVTLLNLTGRQIVGKNALLVFVNVFGRWVGLIVDAPAGTQAAAIGNATDTALAPPLSLNAQESQSITNNIYLDAQSGDATVSQNTSAGNAKSGNANTSANVANIMNSSLSFTDWFGVLFINVFGNWTGSFGIDTEAGNKKIIPQTAAVSASTQVASTQESTSTSVVHRIFYSVVGSSQQMATSNDQEVLSDSTSTPQEQTTTTELASAPLVKQPPSISNNPSLLSIIGAMLGLSMLAIERTVYYRHKQSGTK